MASGGWHRLGGVNQVKGGRTGFVRQPSLMPGKLSWQHQLEFAREPEPIGWINTHTYMHTRTHVESTNVKIVTATAGEEPSSLLSLWGWVAQNTDYARSSHLSPREQQLSICLACEAGYLNSHNLVPQTLRVPGELWVLSSWGRTGKAGSDVLDQVLNSNNRVYQLSSQREGRGSKRRSPVVHVFIGTATRRWAGSSYQWRQSECDDVESPLSDDGNLWQTDNKTNHHHILFFLENCGFFFSLFSWHLKSHQIIVTQRHGFWNLPHGCVPRL